ncbi:(d)CMP kinase [Aquibaculum sediminis]|uniref:(d)CMP kinase n=1 Tax=Aquibaculum sediminis TaxID=3231907 RepID=UPI003455C756
MSHLVIAVDGPAAAGKGTLSRRLAVALDLAYLDTGSIYRAVAARLLEAGGDPADPEQAAAIAAQLDPADLDREDLRSEAAGAAASCVSAHPAVRTALLDFQRRFAGNPPGEHAGAVIDGRDIGTVVCPDASVKLFVTASIEARARRRYEELLARGEKVIYAEVQAEMQARDARDRDRDVAPLRAADDAVTLDTTDLSAEAVFQAALEIIAEKTGRSLAAIGKPVPSEPN